MKSKPANHEVKFIDLLSSAQGQWRCVKDMVVRKMELRFATETHPSPGSDRGGRDQMVPYHQPLLPANDREVAPQLLAIEDIKVEEDDEEPLEQPPEGWLSVSWQ